MLLIVSPTHHAFDDLIFAVVLLHFEKVIAEVEDVKASLLSQEGDDHAAGPVEAISKALPAEGMRCMSKAAARQISSGCDV